jgi:hypothetical protein
MVSRRRSDDGAGRPTLCRHHHRAHQEPCPIPKSAPPPSQNGLKIACAGHRLAGGGGYTRLIQFGLNSFVLSLVTPPKLF